MSKECRSVIQTETQPVITNIQSKCCDQDVYRIQDENHHCELCQQWSCLNWAVIKSVKIGSIFPKQSVCNRKLYKCCIEMRVMLNVCRWGQPQCDFVHFVIGRHTMLANSTGAWSCFSLQIQPWHLNSSVQKIFTVTYIFPKLNTDRVCFFDIYSVTPQWILKYWKGHEYQTSLLLQYGKFTQNPP